MNDSSHRKTTSHPVKADHSSGAQARHPPQPGSTPEETEVRTISTEEDRQTAISFPLIAPGTALPNIPLGSVASARTAVTGAPPIALQQLWVDLCERDTWNSISLVPCDEDVDIRAIGHGIAQAAAADRHCKVLLILLSPEKSAKEKVGPQGGTDAPSRGAHVPSSSTFYETLDLSPLLDGESVALHHFADAYANGQEDSKLVHGHIIFALSSLQSRPKGRHLATSTNLSFLFFRESNSLYSDAEKAIAMIGRDKVGGCIAITT